VRHVCPHHAHLGTIARTPVVNRRQLTGGAGVAAVAALAATVVVWPRGRDADSVPAADRSSAVTAIVGADVVNPDGFESIEDATVVVEGSRITSVGPRDEIDVPDGATIIDGEGRWLIPGLMDLHVHFYGDGNAVCIYEGCLPEPEGLFENGYAPDIGLVDPAIGVEANLRRLVRSGVTTVRSTGELEWAYLGSPSLRDRAAADPMAPRIVLGTPTFWPRFDAPDDERVTTPEQGRELVRLFDEEGDVDMLKIWFVDGRFAGEPSNLANTDAILDADDVAAIGAPSPEQGWDELLPIVEAMIEEADERNLPVGVDAIEVEKAKEVMRLGAGLVHGPFFGEVDDEFIEIALEMDTDIVLTMIASERYFGVATGQFRPPTAELLLSDPNAMANVLDVRALDTDELVILPGGSRFDGLTLTEALEQPPYTEEISNLTENVRRMHEAGVPFGVGTDTGLSGMPFGAAIFEELDRMLAAGLEPREILTAATITNARIIGMDDELGSISEGKTADLVLLEADPMLDIANTSRNVGVMRNGRFFSPAELNDDSPFEVVTRLRNAFNSGDRTAIERLLAEEVTVGDLDGIAASTVEDAVDALAEGADGDALKTVIDWTSNGSVVVQHERWPDASEHVVRYVVTDGLIATVTVLT
jgi:imidazolonepropionase-like amidohydrolase